MDPKERRLRRLMDGYDLQARLVSLGARWRYEKFWDRVSRSFAYSRVSFGEKLGVQIEAMRLVRRSAGQREPHIWEARDATGPAAGPRGEPIVERIPHWRNEYRKSLAQESPELRRLLTSRGPAE